MPRAEDEPEWNHGRGDTERKWAQLLAEERKRRSREFWVEGLTWAAVGVMAVVVLLLCGCSGEGAMPFGAKEGTNPPTCDAGGCK